MSVCLLIWINNIMKIKRLPGFDVLFTVVEFNIRIYGNVLRSTRRFEFNRK